MFCTLMRVEANCRIFKTYLGCQYIKAVWQNKRKLHCSTSLRNHPQTNKYGNYRSTRSGCKIKCWIVFKGTGKGFVTFKLYTSALNDCSGPLARPEEVHIAMLPLFLIWNQMSEWVSVAVRRLISCLCHDQLSLVFNGNQSWGWGSRSDFRPGGIVL